MADPAARRATSRDVARLAGVAQSTVSNLLTGAHPVAPEKRERILAAMAELSYRPNLAARAMRTRRTGRLAVVVPGITHVPTRLLAGASAAAQAAGRSLEVHGLAGDDAERAVRLTELVDSGQVEGVLALAPVPGVADRDGSDGGTPLLTLTTFDGELHQRDDVTDASPVAELVARLAELGHTRFLHVAGSPEYASARARRAAYLAAVERAGVDSLGVADGDWSPSSGVAAVHGLTEADLPVAIIAANDRVALGVVRGARERGWSVPGDVAVTGWDDLDVGAYLWPSLTTVRIDEASLGRLAIEHLVELVAGREPDGGARPAGAPRDGAPREGAVHESGDSAVGPDPFPLRQSIVWRESTAPPTPR